jgi:PAS domain S-box-containing protein
MPGLKAIKTQTEEIARAWQRHGGIRYAFAAIVMLAAARLRLWLEAHYGVTPPYITFYPATMLVAVIGGFGPGVLTTLLSGAFAGIVLLDPRGEFSIARPADAIGLAVFMTMGILISVMAGTLHRRKDHEQQQVKQALRDSEDQFRMVIEGVEDYAIFMLDPDGRVVTWNAGAERIKGWSAAEIIGQDFSRIFPADAVAARHPRALLAAAAKGTYREEAERIRKDGSRFWADITISALHDDAGRLRGFANITRDISERKRATQSMAESRSRLATVVGSAMDAIITMNEEQSIVLFNAAAEAMFGTPAAEALGGKLEQFVPLRFRSVHADHVRGFAKTGVTSRAMGQLGTLSGVRRDGSEFPIEASISQASVDGHKLFTVILRDITERKRAEEHRSLLLGELVHRVKNTLAVVQSIAAQTRRFTAPEQFHELFTGRLMALGVAHDLLTRSEWDGAKLADVIRSGFAPYNGSGAVGRWTINGPDIWLAPNEAVTLSLAFHELATNAARFGALSHPNGKVVVQWHVDPESLAIHWSESGGPTIQPPVRCGFGSKLLEKAVAHELGGVAKVEFLPAGAECWLRFPLSPRIRVQP